MSVLPELVIGIGLVVGFGLIVLLAYKIIVSGFHEAPPAEYPAERSWFLLWPGRWLAIKSTDLNAVQAALRLHHPRPCPWLEGMAQAHNLFISPPVDGWILVTGGALPEPGEDVDACFRFILNLSRELGEVQFFEAQRMLHHHAWVKARDGRVIRAYAWAGETVWNQGRLTRAEKLLGLKCYEYGEISDFWSSWKSANRMCKSSVAGRQVELLRRQRTPT